MTRRRSAGRGSRVIQLLGGSRVVRAGVEVVRGSPEEQTLLSSGYFDLSWYELQTDRAFGSLADAVQHYLLEGRAADLSPHRLYEPSFHLPKADRAREGDAPFVRFLRAARRGVSAHPLFDPARWSREHPAAAKHPYGPWGHFLDSARDDTLLPVPAWVDGGSLRWGEVTRLLDEAAARWVSQQRIAGTTWLSERRDAAAERALRDELGAAAAPERPPGGAPLVSVVLPVRNRPLPVVHALASLTGQTLGDWECLVVDDGSDDDTPEVVAEMAARDPRVRLIRTEHGGVCHARNLGLDHARGRYVAFLDSDTTWAPGFLDTMTRAMAHRRVRAAHAVLEYVKDGVTRFRRVDGGVEHLAVGNYVDLNVLVLERSLLDEIGGFDAGLRRAVDYDLVYRAALRTDLVHVPTPGACYHDDDSDLDRISVKELKTWNYVVRDRYVVDWPRVTEGVRRRASSRTSVLVTGREQWRPMWRSVLSVLSAAAPEDALEVVVVDGASSRSASLLIGLLAGLDPRVTTIRTVANYHTGGGLNVALGRSTGATVVVLDPGATVRQGWLEPLRAVLEDRSVLAAQPLLLGGEGLVVSAGWVFPRHARAAPPVPLLADHPVADAERLGEVVEVPAGSAAALAMRAEDLVAVRGFDPLYVEGPEDADLTLRLARERGEGRTVLVTGSRVVVGPRGRSGQGPGPVAEANRRLFAARWAGSASARAEASARLWSRAGFTVEGWRPVEDTAAQDSARVRPVLSRAAERTVEPLRWAVAADSTDGAAEELADRLAGGLLAAGQQVVRRDTRRRRIGAAYLDQVHVVVGQGAAPAAGPVAVLWTGDGTGLPASDLHAFDVVVTGDADVPGPETDTGPPVLTAVDPAAPAALVRLVAAAVGASA